MLISKVFRKNTGGFTLIELMIVIAIIGILAAIAIPQFASYRIRGYNVAARSDAKNAFTASQAFFSDSPAGVVTTAIVGAYGYRGTVGVTLIAAGSRAALAITSAHVQGTTTYMVDSEGNITP